MTRVLFMLLLFVAAVSAQPALPKVRRLAAPTAARWPVVPLVSPALRLTWAFEGCPLTPAKPEDDQAWMYRGCCFYRIETSTDCVIWQQLAETWRNFYWVAIDSDETRRFFRVWAEGRPCGGYE